MAAERFEHTAEKARRLLVSLWERNLPVLRERVEELERAAAAASAGTLSAEARENAGGTAHKLAGSLGMFGYPKGTEAARRVEQQLEGEAPVDAQELARNVAELVGAVPL